MLAWPHHERERAAAPQGRLATVPSLAKQGANRAAIDRRSRALDLSMDDRRAIDAGPAQILHLQKAVAATSVHQASQEVRIGNHNVAERVAANRLPALGRVDQGAESCPFEPHRGLVEDAGPYMEPFRVRLNGATSCSG